MISSIANLVHESCHKLLNDLKLDLLPTQEKKRKKKKLDLSPRHFRRWRGSVPTQEIKLDLRKSGNIRKMPNLGGDAA